MNRRYIHFILLLLIATLGTAALSAQSASFPTAEEIEEEALILYTQALEALLDEEPQEAISLFQAVTDSYPESPLAKRAEAYLAELQNKLDRGGIVGFYLGSLATASLVTSGIPVILEVTDPIIYGVTGLVGIGSGLGAAYLMTEGKDMTFGQDLWIEFMQAVSMLNYMFGYSIASDYIFADNEDGWRLEEKFSLGGQIVTALTSRALTYLNVIDSKPSPGRAGFVINSYGWAHYYYWITMVSIIESYDEHLNNAFGMIIPDAAAAGAYFAWDNLRWTFNRSGLVTVGGIGGALIGGFINLIAGELIPEFGSQAAMSVLLLSTMAGQGAGVYFTQGLEPEARISAARTASAGGVMWSLTPSFTSGNPGVALRVMY